MNKKVCAKISIFSLLFLFILSIACSFKDKKFSVRNDTAPPNTINKKDNCIKCAYQNYAFACLAFNEGKYGEAETFLKEALKYDQNSHYLMKRLSRILFKNNKTEDALYIAKKVVDLAPDDMEARELLADLYTKLEKIDLAVSQYSEILSIEPEKNEIRLYLISLLIRLERFETALDELSVLIKKEPELLLAHYYKGRIFMEIKEYEKAKKALLKSLEINPKFFPSLFDLAALYRKTDQIDLALKTYEEIVRLYPDNLETRERLINFHYEIGNDELAEKHINEMKGMISSGDLERKRIGIIYLKNGKLEDSIAEFRSMISTWPNNQEIRYYLGAALEENGDLNEAYENFDLISLENKDFINARLHMAYILEKQKKTSDAITILRNAIKQKGNDPRLYLMLESIYEKEGDFIEAKNVLEQGLKYNENNIDLHFRLGIVFDKMKKSEECIKQMEIVIAIDPENADALNYIGYTFADKGINLDRALNLIQRALKKKPDAGFIVDSLGWVYFKKGNYKNAIKHLKRAAELTPEDPAIMEHLGDAFFRINEYTKALEIYKKTLLLENADKDRLKTKIKDTEERLRGD